jgi:hypothetical protein
MTFLLTVSPKEAVKLLNGTLSTLIRKWKVPLGMAYIAVRKAKDRLVDVLHNGDTGFYGETVELSKPFFLKLPDETTVVRDKKWNEVNGKIIAKCEINSVMQYPTLHQAIIYLSNISVLDKPMEVSQFYRKPFKDCKPNCEELPCCSELRLTRLPSRWQEVEVGE